MEIYKTIQPNNIVFSKRDTDSNITFHEDIIDMLFKHKEEIYNNLLDLKGVFLTDHIAIKIIDPKKKMVVFSMTPSVEYNLIVQGLWKYDKSFSLEFQKQHSFYTWEDAYSEKYFNEIKYIKQ